MGQTLCLADCAAAPPLFYGGIVVPFGETGESAASFERLKARPWFVRVVEGGGALFPDGAKNPQGGELNGDSKQGGHDPRHFHSLSRQRSQIRRGCVQRRFPLHSPYDDNMDKRHISNGAGRAATGSNGTSWSKFRQAMKPLSPTAASPRAQELRNTNSSSSRASRSSTSTLFRRGFGDRAFIKSPGSLRTRLFSWPSMCRPGVF